MSDLERCRTRPKYEGRRRSTRHRDRTPDSELLQEIEAMRSRLRALEERASGRPRRLVNRRLSSPRTPLAQHAPGASHTPPPAPQRESERSPALPRRGTSGRCTSSPRRVVSARHEASRHRASQASLRPRREASLSSRRRASQASRREASLSSRRRASQASQSPQASRRRTRSRSIRVIPPPPQQPVTPVQQSRTPTRATKPEHVTSDASVTIAVTDRLVDAIKCCTFPPRWYGRWFQSGVIQPIIIDGDRLSNKGKCVSSEGDKFLIVDEKGCYRCVVMHEKHQNVLQYKETYCYRRDALPHLCTLITGDALLYSMFRENADPVDCPLRGPFSFTYNRGHGDCKSPVSSIESCTEDSRLLLNYQACPDVHGSESTVEELECLATWKEGSLRFLVGKLHHNHATSNEDRYRCFVYEKTNGIASGNGAKDGPTSPAGVEYRVAQSGDATCNGLFSATEGSRTMALKRVSVRFNCQFPTWMTFSHTWHTLDFSSNYTFYQRNATLRITNQTGADIKVYCVNVKASSPSGNSVALVAHWQHHCVSRYVCVVLYRRDTYIAELQRGAPTSRPDDACSPHHFNAVTAPYVTLVASNPESKECPYSGKYTIQNSRHQRSVRSLHKSDRTRSKREKAIFEHNRRVNGTRLFNFSVRNMSSAPMLRSRRQAEGEVACLVSNYNRLEVGCNSVKNMEFYSTCQNKDVVTAYTCHGGWYENGASFVVTTPVTRDSTAARRYCFMSREARGGTLVVTRSAANCERASGEPELVFDAQAIGECQDQTNSQPLLRIPTPILVSATTVILHYIIPR